MHERSRHERRVYTQVQQQVPRFFSATSCKERAVTATMLLGLR